MLLKYLNELDAAVSRARTHPDQAHMKRCVECATVLEHYLQGQMEPVRLKGEELMRKLWPADLHLATRSPVASRSVTLH